MRPLSIHFGASETLRRLASAHALAIGVTLLTGLPALGEPQLGEHLMLPRRQISAPVELAVEARDLLGLRRCEVISLDLPAEATSSFQVSRASSGAPFLELDPHSVRADDYRLFAREPGSVVEVEQTAPKTVRGTLAGAADSFVAGSILPEGLFARILSADGEELWIEPLLGRVEGATRSHHIAYRLEDVLPGSHTCATDVLARVPATVSEPFATTPGGAHPGIRFAELACDTDFEFFTNWGSVIAAQDRIELVINVMNLQFERDVDITHELAAILVQTSASQPYNSTDSNALLNEFRTHWNSAHEDIQRDLAQLFTGKDLDGSVIGRAWVGATCSSSGYSIVQSDFSSVLSLSTDLSAHELGHNWDAGHCSCPENTMNPYITGSNKFHPIHSIPDIIAQRDSSDCIDGGFGRDLVITDMDVSTVIGPGGSYVVQGTLENRGADRATGVIEVSALLLLRRPLIGSFQPFPSHVRRGRRLGGRSAAPPEVWFEAPSGGWASAVIARRPAVDAARPSPP